MEDCVCYGDDKDVTKDIKIEPRHEISNNLTL